MRILLFTALITLTVAACNERANGPGTEPSSVLFTLMPGDETGIDFVNQLDYDKSFNIFSYRNFYNGGGVAIGDVNNDGLPDIYLTANRKPNRLYLNKGEMKFEDVTEKAGVAGQRAWSTGVSMADVNGDGWLDIYVCNSGDIEGDNKQNELFLNQQNGTFLEAAEAYGLADRGYSTHAAFFDYDKDGDLDCYLLNNSYQAIGSFNLRKNERPVRDRVGGDKLYRNDNDKFVDVSAEAGIYGSVIGFGLGVTVGDIDRDGWQDIYVSNDFFERDYLYVNNQDGTFREVLEQEMRSISAASMGADMADFNNDGYPDIFVTEMLPEDDARLKTKTTFENWDRYQYNLKHGYYHQFTRNMLQLNNANGTFSEIGRLAGVHATDWSWGALIADYDNDGHKDLFVANGIFQDLTDQDYIQFFSNEEAVKSIVNKEGVDFKKLIDAIPSNRIPNYLFINQGDYQFVNKAEEWGMGTPSHSNGSAYGDLDNDGDLDLVVNNVNMEAFLYRNEASTLRPNQYLQLELKGVGKNPFALGTKMTIRHQGQTFYLEQMPMRGFESSVDYRPHFGLGTAGAIDSLIVEWPDGSKTIRTQVAAGQLLRLSQKEAGLSAGEAMVAVKPAPLFQEVANSGGIPYEHQENLFVDFDRDRLLYHMRSTEGPKLAISDINGDGREDFYACGAKGQAGQLFVQQPNGRFTLSNGSLFTQDAGSEDVDALFFDADKDNDLDLYVASGGSEFSSTALDLFDRLYFNDGQGHFTKSSQVLPTARPESSGCVVAADFDRDGDQDLFVGQRQRPFLYGVPTSGHLLENDGKGKFTEVSSQLAPALNELGMITDALWLDYDRDGDEDLIVVGEWMPIHVFQNENGQLRKVTEAAGLANTHGWWNTINAADIDNDGDQDLVIGNHGWNSRFKASPERPISMVVNDFDQNGTVEQVISMYNGEESFPVVLRHDLIQQLPGLKKKYLKYGSYKNQTVEDIFSPEQLEKAIRLKAYVLASSLAINKGDGTFELRPLPAASQFSPVYAIQTGDFNGDAKPDILLGGNLYGVKPEVGRYDASYGLFLKGDGTGNFQPVRAAQSGLMLQGQVRDIRSLTIGEEKYILVARNNASLQVYQAKAPRRLPD